jgi:hypothetical protein
LSIYSQSLPLVDLGVAVECFKPVQGKATQTQATQVHPKDPQADTQARPKYPQAQPKDPQETQAQSKNLQEPPVQVQMSDIHVHKPPSGFMQVWTHDTTLDPQVFEMDEMSVGMSETFEMDEVNVGMSEREVDLLFSTWTNGENESMEDMMINDF